MFLPPPQALLMFAFGYFDSPCGRSGSHAVRYVIAARYTTVHYRFRQRPTGDGAAYIVARVRTSKHLVHCGFDDDLSSRNMEHRKQ